MSNIKLTLIPTVENFQLLDILIGGNGVADYRDLAQLQLPPDIDWRKGVIINGRGPIWLYAYLVHQCHTAAWVAVMDLRHGGIVVEVHHPDAPAVGSVIALEVIRPFILGYEESKPPEKPPRSNRRAIIFVGPPHSGKSVLVGAVYRQLQQSLPVEEFQREVFLLRACPDGEGNWFSEISPDLAKTLRFKNHWDDEFVTQVCRDVENFARSKRLLLVDAGGKIDRRNQQILNCCTHAVIVSCDQNAVAEWRGALQAAEITVLAEIVSSLEEVCEVIEQSPLRLRLGPLERERREVSLPAELLEVFT